MNRSAWFFHHTLVSSKVGYGEKIKHIGWQTLILLSVLICRDSAGRRQENEFTCLTILLLLLSRALGWSLSSQLNSTACSQTLCLFCYVGHWQGQRDDFWLHSVCLLCSIFSAASGAFLGFSYFSYPEEMILMRNIFLMIGKERLHYPDLELPMQCYLVVQPLIVF